MLYIKNHRAPVKWLSLQEALLITYGDVRWRAENVQILIDLMPDFRKPFNYSHQIRRWRTTLIRIHRCQSPSHVATQETVNRLQLIGIMNGMEPVTTCCDRFRFRLLVNRRLIHCCYDEWAVYNQQVTTDWLNYKHLVTDLVDWDHEHFVGLVQLISTTGFNKKKIMKSSINILVMLVEYSHVSKDV